MSDVPLSDDQIKRLGQVVDFKEDPLAPFKELHAYLEEHLKAARVAGAEDVTFSCKELAAVMPQRQARVALSLSLPAGLRAVGMAQAEKGWNDAGDSDHNTGDSSDPNSVDRRDPSGDD